MTTLAFEDFETASFHAAMAAQAQKIDAIGKQYSKLRLCRGVNQTLAMECENLLPGFISRERPLKTFSVLPTNTNYKVSLEELNNVQVGAIVVGVGLISALLYKLFKWFKKWFSGEDGEGGSGSGDSSALPSSGHVSTERASTVVVGAVDVIKSIEQIQKDLVEAEVKGGTTGRMDSLKKFEKIVADAYEEMVKNTTATFDDFVNNTGSVQILLNLHEGSLKEAPTKLRDMFNKLEQIVNTYTSTSDSAVRVTEVDKLATLRTEHADTKSFWYGGELAEGKALEEVSASFKDKFTNASNTKSKVASELESRVVALCEKMRNGLHATYEKLEIANVRLHEEVERDLSSKVKSLQDKIEKDMSNLPAGDDNAEFVANAGFIVQQLGKDVSAVANYISSTEKVLTAYVTIIKKMPKANEKIINAFTAESKKLRATSITIELEKLKKTNQKFIK